MTHPLFETELRTLIDVEIERLKNNMAGAQPLDHLTYTRTSGEIAGLRRAAEYIDEAESNLNKR